MIERLSV